MTLCFDERIVSTYRDVITRGELLFGWDPVEALIDLLEGAGSPVLAPPLAATLPDPWGEMFIEVAVFGGADFLVTGKLILFPEKERAGGVPIVFPCESIDTLLTGQGLWLRLLRSTDPHSARDRGFLKQSAS